MPAIIELDHVSKHFRRRDGHVVQAVNDICLTLQEGRTLSLVGESGCGKSTTARMILGLEVPSAGNVLYTGDDLSELDTDATQRYREAVQAVFQNPWSSLNPRMKIASIVGEPIEIMGQMSRREIRSRVIELLQQVGLTSRHADLYPHELSGGQRQRVAIARALTPSPKLIVLDEPVSALDVSIRAQIINLLKDVQEQTGLGYLMISHDLLTVWVMSDDVAVMYLGQIVEKAPAEELHTRPLHPYSQALIASSLPVFGAEQEESGEILAGEVPSPLNPPSGCRFHTRCRYASERCSAEAPQLRELGNDHKIACHLY